MRITKKEARGESHFVRFVEIFFAVVLGSSLLRFSDILFPPSISTPSFWALVVVYFAATTSWIGWHDSTTEYPYTQSTPGLARSVLDAAIVVVYAALLFLASQVERYLSWYLWGFVFVFVMYLSVGLIRRAEHGPQASKLHLIFVHGAVLLIGAVAFTVSSYWSWQLPVEILWVLVLMPIAVVGSYRWFRNWRALPWTVRITVAVDLDGVIVEQVIPVLEKLKNEGGLSLSKSDITDWEYKFLETDIKTEIEKAERERVFVSNMPPMLGAVRALQILSLARNLNVVVATSREVLTDRWNQEWLSKNQVPYGKYINTRSDGKALPGVDILIDDYIGNIEQFIRKGTANRQAILFAQPLESRYWGNN
ncbi:MAG: hypothetical protein AB1597_08435 [Chloroflexota bacterium]